MADQNLAQTGNTNLDELRKIYQSINSTVKQAPPAYTPPSILKKNVEVENMTGTSNPPPVQPKKVGFNGVEASESIVPENVETPAPAPTTSPTTVIARQPLLIDGYTIANVLLPKQTVYLACVLLFVAIILFYLKK